MVDFKYDLNNFNFEKLFWTVTIVIGIANNILLFYIKIKIIIIFNIIYG